MRQTRSEMIKALRQTLGQSEETEHVIDWVQDAWSTYDHLSKLIGKAYACQIMEATHEEDRFIELEEGVSHERPFEYINGCLLN